jgi:anaerobic dimethyl sulfoxide reductase subunit B (iron-sulfur subunit)
VRRAFTFDASSCTGCKACQVACKDAHGLPPGVLWRRVYEVTGGGWERRGAAWTNTVFAYHVSIACNHCAEPACVAACPTGACVVRDDGVVWIDGVACAGCEYCAWACPYSAPQYSADLGRMTKCDLCRDLVDEGGAPACVSACPMRALDLVEMSDVAPAVHPYPLPAASLTRPRIVITPHAAAQSGLVKQVGNREEVHPPGLRRGRTLGGLHLEDLPLVLFTLLGQAAAGVAVVALFGAPTPVPLLGIAGVAIALAAFAALFHLGAVSRAWRTPANAAASALSREVIAFGLFAAAWTAAWLGLPGGPAIFAATGVLLVFAMAEVYSLDAVPAWSRDRVRLSFATSAVLFALTATLAVADGVPAWMCAAIAAAAFAQQVGPRWGLYAARRARAL